MRWSVLALQPVIAGIPADCVRRAIDSAAARFVDLVVADLRSRGVAGLPPAADG